MPADLERQMQDASKANEADPTGKDKAQTQGLEVVPSSHWSHRLRIKWTITLFAGCFLVYSVRTSMSIANTALSSELGWNKQVSGMVLSSFFAGYVTTNVLGGYLADRFSGERVILYSSFVWAATHIMVPVLARYPYLIFSTNTFGVLAARFLTGVGQGMFFPSMTSIVTRRNTVVERAFVWSLSNSGASVGTIFSGLVGSILIEQLGWPSLFFITGILTFIWIIVLGKFVTTAVNRDKNNRKLVPQREAVPWLLLFSKRPTWALLIVYFCNNFCFYNLLSWLPVYFHESFPNSKGWIFNVVPWVANVIVGICAGILSRRLLSYKFSVTFVRKLSTSIALFGSGTFLLLLDFVETFEQALFLMTVILGLMSFANVGHIQNSQDLAPKHAGALYGVMNTAGAFSGIIGVYVSGHLLEASGQWSAVFTLSSAACFFGSTIFLLMGTGERIV